MTLDESKQNCMTFLPYDIMPSLNRRANPTRTAMMITISTVPMPFLFFSVFMCVPPFASYKPSEIIAGVIATRSTATKSKVIGKRRARDSLSCFFLAALRHRFQHDED